MTDYNFLYWKIDLKYLIVLAENSYTIQSQKVDQQQSARLIFNIVEPTGVQFINENLSSIAKSVCQAQQFAVVENMNNLHDNLNQNSAFNKILDELNCNSDQNINKLYLPFSKTLEQAQLKQDSFYTKFPIVSNLNKPGTVFFLIIMLFLYLSIFYL